MTKLTQEQAVTLANSGWWKSKSAKDIARFQLFEDRLCMPFEEFQKAVEEALGRPVWTHEFAYAERLREEFLGSRPTPTFEEILELIPEAKRILVEV